MTAFSPGAIINLSSAVLEMMKIKWPGVTIFSSFLFLLSFVLILSSVLKTADSNIQVSYKGDFFFGWLTLIKL